ncbi:nicotinamide riboside transporter PnuC [Rubrivirga sp. S365]|uniref:Nicotinamide riboside transporter PnuC n=1 Tax=Rubrivirga litoralis TaxID=3075598 RepID=A0ABU3BLU3_9BACT|nr:MULTISPECIES: nicotinamide riboside transporter PnuC [unclassified Rubrivirga]MDT0630241.1 nicotinamide riboside transporter PnuC [Rubrivirga sp. F394]MDT7855752.1 nicotinamide riboside transporter PnuC [Rubrivirga sp. S365]
MTALEVAGNVFVLASVYLARRNSVHTWWTAMIGVVLYGVMFYGARLYADVVLQAFFFGTAVVGWRAWLWGGAGGGELPITALSARGRGGAVLAVVVGTLAAGTLFGRFTNAALPYADSFILGGSVVAQLLMMRRKLDHWPIWIAVDVVAVAVYAAKGLLLTSAVYVVLLVLSVQGLVAWRRTYADARPALA